MAKGSGRRHFPSGATGSCTVAWSEHRGTSRDPRQCSPLREHPSPPEPGAGLTQLSLGSVELLLSWSPALTQRLCGRPVTLWGPWSLRHPEVAWSLRGEMKGQLLKLSWKVERLGRGTTWETFRWDSEPRWTQPCYTRKRSWLGGRGPGSF